MTWAQFEQQILKRLENPTLTPSELKDLATAGAIANSCSQVDEIVNLAAVTPQIRYQ